MILAVVKEGGGVPNQAATDINRPGEKNESFPIRAGLNGGPS
jgi:hypothetical protein